MTDESNSKSLSELQHAFAQSQHYKIHGLDSDIHAGRFSVDQRLQIYRNNYIVSLSEVLAAGYPATQAVVGEECFTQLARYHVLHHPANSGDITIYGAGLAHSIAAQPSLIEAVPYLTDLATLEWAVDRQTQHGEPERVFPIAALSERLQHEGEAYLQRVVLVPQGELHRFPTAVGSLWQMVKTNHVEPCDMTAAEICWVHYRQGPQVLVLNDDSAALIALAQQARPLAEASDGMLRQLTELIQQQIFVHFWESPS
uniref:HvfC/BufC N-terminal domain-containing protein n=1 Tax=Thaumasiovibrio occultus TaxID=1891184 RepID=UPI00131EBD18|nr:DNA-binding domain-containing protein [Thaumasiovibrio occultus]